MENKEIIRLLRRTASLMEINGANPFKVRAINNALFNLERVDGKLADMDADQLRNLKGIGKSIAEQIAEIIAENESTELRKLTNETPRGVVELLAIPGLGAKKIRTLWQEEGISSPVGLKKAIEEGRLEKIKGFGKKTIDKIHSSLEFYMDNQHKMLLSEALPIHTEIMEDIRQTFGDIMFQPTAAMRRKDQIIPVLNYLIEEQDNLFRRLSVIDSIEYDPEHSSPYNWRGIHKDSGMQICIRKVSREHFTSALMLTTGPLRHIHALGMYEEIRDNGFTSEKDIYAKAGKEFIPADIRVAQNILDQDIKTESLIREEDIKGILHCHSTYSDGQQSIREMAEACRDQGYGYMGITDHSKSSFFYANGLFENRIREQFAEIDEIQKEFKEFRIFKGIECDILSDGSLDYDEDILAEFDFIVISVHSVLQMDLKTATERLVKAIENPYSTILGHLTGRLLLRRQGYPLHMPTILDACKSNNVTIEINANPRRLDIDWTYLPDVLEKGIKISINPDAHNIRGFADVKYGVMMARKGLVTPKDNLTSMSAEELNSFFKSRKAMQLSKA